MLLIGIILWLEVSIQLIQCFTGSSLLLTLIILSTYPMFAIVDGFALCYMLPQWFNLDLSYSWVSFLQRFPQDNLFFPAYPTLLHSVGFRYSSSTPYWGFESILPRDSSYCQTIQLMSYAISSVMLSTSTWLLW